MTGYIIDDSVLVAGLTGAGKEHHHRELSRLLHGAIDGGPALDAPALCLTTAAEVRPAIVGHVADLVAAAPPGAIDICGLSRTGFLDALRAFHPGLSWPAIHAAVHALATGLPVLTTEPERYVRLGINSLRL
ncbi:MAG: hypothetical protein HKP61_16380 [Dactylosporangium sp.]|nr:hypothetical protein [Dactylosporangium sp.]NNJ62484.1 hypothetical protein [Dactylosporangium sp.]